MSAEQAAFSRGLEDIVAAESSICQIDGKNSKLYFRGYSVHDLWANSNFEETAYLLLFGALPTQAQLADFNSKLAAERLLPSGFDKAFQVIPKDAHPMAALRTAVSILALFDHEADDKSLDSNIRKAIRLLARTPSLVANYDRMRRNQPWIQSKKDPKVSTAADFLYMLKGKEASALDVKMLDQYFILLAEHDLNASTFTARVEASTQSDIYSAVVGGIGTLKGDLHGSANSRAMESLLEIGDVSKVDPYVEDALSKKKKLMGFGHRVYKGPDPRAADLRVMAQKMAENNAEQTKWYAISEKLEKAVWERKKLYCNVDFYSASVLYTLGIPVDLFTAMFAISRMAGWTAHFLEQSTDNRLIRPVSYYTGKSNLTYTSIQNR